jgi:hypothetical protein
MLRTKERIKEIKNTALENLKTADNWGHSRKGIDKEKYWTLYRSDVRELLGVIEDYETPKTLAALQKEMALIIKEKGNDKS